VHSSPPEATRALALLGWDAAFAESFAPHAAKGLLPARVCIAHGRYFTLLDAEGEVLATAAGKLRLNARPADLPVVGDWVAMRPPLGGDSATVHAVLPRRTRFSRKSPDRPAEEQVIAANVDTAFLVTDLVRDFNVRRLERYLALVSDSGARPVVVLTKEDLADSSDESVAAVAASAPGVPVHVVSNLTGSGFDAIDPYFIEGRTVALLGSSGVGKSTLINRLLGEERQSVADVRDDGRGRHTTSHRELILLPKGGMIIDNPGMRELHLWESADGIRDSFDDIQAAALGCRFTDCRHESEPGCAVKEAVENGSIAPDRLASYFKLRGERDRLGELQDEQVLIERKRAARTLGRTKQAWRKINPKR
jgi:ribosome biogenesis GTPase / thiamine phosphate phosphatase